MSYIPYPIAIWNGANVEIRAAAGTILLDCLGNITLARAGVAAVISEAARLQSVLNIHSNAAIQADTQVLASASLRSVKMIQDATAAKAIAAVGDVITAVGYHKLVTVTGAIVLTSAPTIADGNDGEFLCIINTGGGGGGTVTLQDQGTLAGSNLRLVGVSAVLGPRDSVLLMYDVAVGDWLQIGPVVAVT